MQKAWHGHFMRGEMVAEWLLVLVLVEDVPLFMALVMYTRSSEIIEKNPVIIAHTHKHT